MVDFRNKRLLITGGGSMLSKSIQRVLKPLWPDCIVDPVLHQHCDLLDTFQVRKRFLYFKPNYVIHLANFSGNNVFNQKYPAETFFRCSQIGLNVLKACHDFDVEKCLSVIPSCAYPHQKGVLVENEFWDGLPHQSVESHGLARRNTVAFGRQLNKVSTTKFVSVVFNLLYGPHDSFDLKKTKVVGAFVKKYCDAARNGDASVTNWGTGKASREFLYVDDAAEGLLRAFLTYEDSDLPLNIGWGTDYSIKELANLAASIADFKGETIWNGEGEGAKSKLLDVSRMKSILNWQPHTLLQDGLVNTVKHYVEKNK